MMTEIVTMKITEMTARDTFIQIVDGLEENYHRKQAGYVDCELLYHDKMDEWIMIQHWDNAENLKRASREIFKHPAAKAFLEAVDSKSVTMWVSSQLAKW